MYAQELFQTGIPAAREAVYKQSFVTRRATLDIPLAVTTEPRPAAGDLVVARVEQLGQHTRLHLKSGRRSQLHEGDRVVVCYGNRYAPDQYEALVPDDLGPCHLVTAGGVAGRVVSRHRNRKDPTVLRPEWLLVDGSGGVVNLRRFGLAAAASAGQRTKPVVAFIGTSMNSGKTTAASSLIRGLCRAGLRVAAIKATGTGSGNDLWSMEDAGAALVLDFTDVGHPSTYLVPSAEIESAFNRLLTYAAQSDVDAIVVEVADGLFHEETGTLVGSQRFAAAVDNLVFCAGDALGAQAGVEWLERRGLPIAGVSGLLTASPLAVREARRSTQLPVWTTDCLTDPLIATTLLVRGA
jgi:dethiobiotin synthetase